MRNQFTFYKSFDDVFEDLSDKQLAEYIKILLDVQFLRVKINDVKFKDKTLSIVWKSQKHSIQTSVDGYINSQKRDGVKNPYYGIYEDECNPYEGGRQGECNPYEGGHQQEEEEEEEEDKGDGVRVFTFTLSTSKLLSSTSKEYQENLKDYIDNSGKNMSFQDFYNQCEMKPYKYKNFKMAYDSWNKEDNSVKAKKEDFLI